MLKCNMIHSFPKEYYSLYESFQDGSGTIKKWINKVEKLGKGLLEKNTDVLRIELESLLPDDVKIKVEDNLFYITGNYIKLKTFMYSMGAKWYVDLQIWSLTIEQASLYFGKDKLNKFRGDMLEVLSEIFFNVFQSDEGLGIRDYEPVLIGEDYGVDATGTNVNGREVAVQVKYRKNAKDLIPYSDIARTFTSAVCQMGMNDVVDYDHTVFLFTTAGGVSVAYDKVLGRKSVVVNRGVISTKIDNNANFWKQAFEMIENT